MIPDKETTASNEYIITISDYYYKKTEIDTMMNGKANTSHTHTTSEITDFPVIPDAVIDTGWEEVTFKSGYSKYNNSTSVYVRRKGNCVELNGVWKTTSTKSAASNPIPFASMPGELAPIRPVNTVCFGKGRNIYMLTVDTDATLCWSRYGVNTNVDLESGDFGHVHCMWTI